VSSQRPTPLSAAASRAERKPPETPAPATAPPGPGTGRPTIDELQATRLPPLQEAAVLFSAGHAAAAKALLDENLRNEAGTAHKIAWVMMLDLLEGLNRRKDYDWYAAGYRDSFGLAAPEWHRGDPRRSDRRGGHGGERPDFYALRTDEEGQLGPAIKALPDFARRHGSVRVDAGTLAELSDEDSAALADALRALRREGLAIWVNRPSSLKGVLHAAVNAPPTPGNTSEGHWRLLLELLILLGESEAYERASLEYAVARDRRPPPWEDYVNPILAAYAARGGNKPVAEESVDDILSLRGVLSADSEPDLRRIADNADPMSEVVIDMSGVLRVDFAACPLLQALATQLEGAGKRVILSGLSELNAALLESFGLNLTAVLLRRETA